MPDLYTEVVDDEGNKTYVVAEPAPTDDETFFADKRYKDVADRDIKRRTKHSDLVTVLEKRGLIVDDKGNVTEKPTTPEPPTTPVVAPLDTDALYKEFMERQAKDKKEADNQASEKRLQMTTLMTQHQLKGDDVMNLLLSSDNPSEAASVLGRLGLKFEDAGGDQGSESDTADQLTTLFENVNRRMGKPDTE